MKKKKNFFFNFFKDESFDLEIVQREDLIDTSLIVDIKKYHFLQSSYTTFLLIQSTLFIQCVRKKIEKKFFS